MADQTESFETIWQRSQTEPLAREVPVRKIEIDFSLDSTLDYFLLTAEKFMQQGKIKKGDFEELTGHITTLKGILDRMNERKLAAEAFAEKAKRRALRLQDEFARLSGLLSGRNPR